MGNLVLGLKQEETIVLTDARTGDKVASMNYIIPTDFNYDHRLAINAPDHIHIRRMQKQRLTESQKKGVTDGSRNVTRGNG